MKVLLIIDAQHDFIDGCLGTPEAQAALPYIGDKVMKSRICIDGILEINSLKIILIEK